MSECPVVWEFSDECCDMPDDVDYSIVERWQAIASGILWRASGRRYGPCEVTVRPCLRHCGGGSLPTPYKDAQGEWRNFATCGCIGDCSCVELCEVVLDGPVDSIVEVLIGEDELMEENYRLDRVGTGYRLLRTDGGCWPSCSDITADCGTADAFCITYMKGLALDDLAIAAFSEATCELVKACIPGCKTCRLPSNVVSIVRRGVAINLEQIKSAVLALPMVAAWLNSVNPQGLTSASSVWSPDVPQTRVTPAPAGS